MTCFNNPFFVLIAMDLDTTHPGLDKRQMLTKADMGSEALPLWNQRFGTRGPSTKPMSIVGAAKGMQTRMPGC